ncbi:hypothetical protein GU926_05820 [Nibribacter ruber]|uniref:DUF748 domain-containing protein n=1 Tax=Nibribacter ruber TaxID=2698458 RepID=A0A6P1NXP1_9BACT|nr:hypothetical protein [Nibribacter ruber]QHL86979.1 hypothetical protein GU926_05820 [Nibribacter ruber]
MLDTLGLAVEGLLFFEKGSGHAQQNGKISAFLRRRVANIFLVEQLSTKSIVKKWFWAMVAVAALLLLAVVWVRVYLDPWAEKKLAEEVRSKSNGEYLLKTGSVDVSLLAGTVTIDSLELAHQPAVWERLQKSNPAQAKAMAIDLQATRVNLTGLSFLDLLQKKPLRLGNLQLDHPNLVLTQMKPDTSQPKPLHEKLTGQLKGIILQKIVINNGRLRYKSSPRQKASEVELTGLKATAYHLQVDSASFQDLSRAFYCQKIEASAATTNLMLPQQYYRLKTGAVALSTTTKQVKVQQAALVPLLGPKALARKAGRAIARFNITVPVLRFSKVQFGTLSRYGNVQVGGVQVLNPSLRAYMDCKNFPIKGVQPLPQDLVQKLPFGLTIKRVAIRSLDVRYEELAPEATQTGTLFVRNIIAQISNLTNDKNLMTQKRPAVVKATGLIMGKAYMAATVKLNLLDPQGRHTIVGRIGPGNPAVLNQMLEPILHMSVKSGEIKKGSFQVSLNRTSAKGIMLIQYDGFKVDLLSKDGEKRQSLGKKLLSFAANKMVIDSDSPSNGKEPAQVPIQVARRSDRSILTYWKDCLADGALHALGVSSMK